jgi:uncharacterized membrane protein required for colicin V production
MIYHKYLWVVGLVLIIFGFMGISQGKVLSGIGFFPIALSVFVAYDKYNPKVRYAKIRYALFLTGLILAFLIWYIGPKVFPGL